MNCKFCGNDTGDRGWYGARDAEFCSDECRYGWHNMNKKILRKERAIEKLLEDLFDMMNGTNDNEQISKIESIAHRLNVRS